MLGQHVEAFGDQLPGLAHAFEGVRAVKLDLAGFAERRDGGVDVGHGPNVRFAGEGGKFLSVVPGEPTVRAKRGR